MNSIDIKETVFKVLSEISGTEVNAEEPELTSDLGLDSMNMVTLLIELEDAFHITLDESDMNPFELICVGDVIKLAKKYMLKEGEK